MVDDKVTDITAAPKKRKAKESLPMEAPERTSMLQFPHMDGKKIQATIENMREMLSYYNIICRYNVISKKVAHLIPNESFSIDNEENAALAVIYSKMKEMCMPTDGHKGYLLRIADENQYNPVLEWVKSKPWDGLSRIQEFCDTIESPEPEAKYLLIRRWLITAMAMANQCGVDSAGCLVLQGTQDMGKTWWIRKLVPDELREQLVRTDATVNPHDKDSVSQVISYWICELGEIGATFAKADLQALKAFITKDHDIMRRPYDMGDSRYPRRTALIASVDQTIYLHDTAGNRRFWTVPCTSINSYHTIDMQQVWAEVLDLIENKGESWRLAPDEKEHIRRINEVHMQIDPIEEMILDKFYSEISMTGNWRTATEIAEQIGIKNVSQKETRTIAGVVRKLNKNDKTKEKFSSGLKLWVPSPRL